MTVDESDLSGAGDLPSGTWTEVEDVPFGHVIFNVAESVVRSQAQLDREAAETMRALADTKVDVVPEITREVGDDGSVDVSASEPEPRSLLELGFTPTRYQFTKTEIEIEFDTKLSKEGKSGDGSSDGSNGDGSAGHRSGLRASTAGTAFHRKLNRSTDSNTTVKATLEPAPNPVGLSPSDSVRSASGSDGGGDGDDGGSGGGDGGGSGGGDGGGDS